MLSAGFAGLEKALQHFSAWGCWMLWMLEVCSKSWHKNRASLALCGSISRIPLAEWPGLWGDKLLCCEHRRWWCWRNVWISCSAHEIWQVWSNKETEALFKLHLNLGCDLKPRCLNLCQYLCGHLFQFNLIKHLKHNEKGSQHWGKKDLSYFPCGQNLAFQISSSHMWVTQKRMFFAFCIWHVVREKKLEPPKIWQKYTLKSVSNFTGLMQIILVRSYNQLGPCPPLSHYLPGEDAEPKCNMKSGKSTEF